MTYRTESFLLKKALLSFHPSQRLVWLMGWIYLTSTGYLFALGYMRGVVNTHSLISQLDTKCVVLSENFVFIFKLKIS